MLMEHEFLIKCKRKISHGTGVTVPTLEVCNILRNVGFYDVHVEVVKEMNDKEDNEVDEFLGEVLERTKKEVIKQTKGMDTK